MNKKSQEKIPLKVEKAVDELIGNAKNLDELLPVIKFNWKFRAEYVCNKMRKEDQDTFLLFAGIKNSRSTRAFANLDIPDPFHLRSNLRNVINQSFSKARIMLPQLVVFYADPQVLLREPTLSALKVMAVDSVPNRLFPSESVLAFVRSFFPQEFASIKLKATLTAIQVHHLFEVLNGIRGMLRDIVLRLCELMVREGNTDGIRTVIGMSLEHRNWKNHAYFLRIRRNKNLSILRGWVGWDRTFFLLYKGSRDGFAGQTFHRLCDSRGATVVIITSSEGCVFGGYASVSWNSLGGSIADNSKQSFLFSLKNARNTPPTRYGLNEGMEDIALRGYSDYGPTFGQHEIVCCNNSNSPDNNYTNLGNYSYSNPTGIEGNTVFTGQHHFSIKEIEVYGVV